MNERINVLWTGGWDSTFRIIYASLVEKKAVAPHYIVDVERQSSLRELKAISEVRRQLKSLDREAAERIDELKITPITEIGEVPEITNSYKRLKSKAHLGSQYDWLARYAKTNHINNLELSVHCSGQVFLATAF